MINLETVFKIILFATLVTIVFLYSVELYRSVTINSFCEEKGYDDYEVIDWKYFNCCRNEVRVEGGVYNKICIAGGVVPNLFRGVEE